MPLLVIYVYVEYWSIMKIQRFFYSLLAVLGNDLSLMIQKIQKIVMIMVILPRPCMNDHHKNIELRELSRFFNKRNGPKCVKLSQPPYPKCDLRS